MNRKTTLTMLAGWIFRLPPDLTFGGLAAVLALGVVAYFQLPQEEIGGIFLVMLILVVVLVSIFGALVLGRIAARRHARRDGEKNQ
ncbi:MAG: hypothetical protein QNJ67_06475 [Kiloniellales bacterium]|nr:hypothetical protein [Kiloniellales bacterium]